jgi:hypothetical protein
MQVRHRDFIKRKPLVKLCLRGRKVSFAMNRESTRERSRLVALKAHSARSEVKNAKNNAPITTRTMRTSSPKMVASTPFMRIRCAAQHSRASYRGRQSDIADNGLPL